MARKIGQFIRRGSSIWLVRIYVGRNLETRKRRYIGKFIHGPGSVAVAGPGRDPFVSGWAAWDRNYHRGKLLGLPHFAGVMEIYLCESTF